MRFQQTKVFVFEFEEFCKSVVLKPKIDLANNPQWVILNGRVLASLPLSNSPYIEYSIGAPP